MPYKIKIREVTLEVDTPEELKQALLQLGVSPSGIQHALRVRMGRKLPDLQEKETLLVLLSALKEIGDTGLSGDEVRQLLEVSEAKVLGSKMHRIRNVLTSLDLDPDQVIVSRRVHGNVKRWYAGPALEDALKRLQ